MPKISFVNYRYRHLMTKVLIVSRLYRDLVRKVFVFHHRCRCFIRKVLVGAIVCGLMLSAWGVARAEENSAPTVQAGSSQTQDTHDETSVPPASAQPTSGPVQQAENNLTPQVAHDEAAGPPQQIESDEAGGPVEQGESNLTPQAESTPSPEPAMPLTSVPAASAPQTSAAAAAVTDEVIFREDEWVAYLNLPADQEAELKRALAVKHRHKSELADIPGVWLVWVDADKDQPPIIRLDVKEGTPVEIDRLAPLEVEGVPVEEVRADQWVLIAPPYGAPTNFSEGTPHGQLSPNATQAAGQGGASNSRTNAAVSLSGWSKIGPVESERNCERSKAFLIWLATDPRFVVHYKQVMQQRGANWSYDQSKMAEMYRDGICVAGSDPRLAGK